MGNKYIYTVQFEEEGWAWAGMGHGAWVVIVEYEFLKLLHVYKFKINGAAKSSVFFARN
jgi:hypothetical protein